MPNKYGDRLPQEITPKEVYDAALRVKRKIGRFSMDWTGRELRASPGLHNRLVRDGDPLRKAYFAAKEGKPFPEE